MLIKICGNTVPENLSQVELLRPDMVGLIFYEKSRRYVGGQLIDYSFKNPAVGVFVNANLDYILTICKTYNITTVQLHGSESPELCATLQKQGYEVYKAFGVASVQDIAATIPYKGTCDYYLFDTQTPDHGGSGKTFDWQILENYTGDTPFFLSGGLGLDNIEKALAFYHPQLKGLDLNSKLEIKPGIKNINHTKQIIQIIRNYERNQT